MTVSVEEAIENGLFAHLAGATLVPALPIAYPNVEMTQNTAGGYLQASYLPNTTENHAFGVEEHSGIFQVSVFWPINQGEIKPTALAAQIIDRFRRVSIVQDGIAIRTIRPPTREPAFRTDSLLNLPVTIRYFAHSYIT